MTHIYFRLVSVQKSVCADLSFRSSHNACQTYVFVTIHRVYLKLHTDKEVDLLNLKTLTRSKQYFDRRGVQNKFSTGISR